MPDDAFGRMVWDHYHDQMSTQPVYRSGDGTAREADPAEYFQSPGDWNPWTRDILTELTGPTLDVGCGAGRHSLWLQQHGTEVVAIDRSPRALAVAHQRGVDQCAVMDMRILGIHQQTFDAALVIGDQLGLGGTIPHFEALLESLASIIIPGGVLVGDLGLPPDGRTNQNATSGESTSLTDEGTGKSRIRVEYGDWRGPWIDLLELDIPALRSVLSRTPWRLIETRYEGGGGYGLVLEREAARTTE